MGFYNIMLCYYFPWKCSYKASENNSTEKQIYAEIQVRLKHALARKLTEGKMESLSLQIAKTDLSYNLQLFASKCFNLYYLLLFLRFLLLTLIMYLFGEKGILVLE